MNSVIATTPAGMLTAQVKMQEWVAHKLADAKRDLSNAESIFNALAQAKLRTNAASTQIRKARLRIAFYEKVYAALLAGYYIVPPFDVQVFAIRTNRKPSKDRGERSWRSDQNAQNLPVGEGRYVDPRPNRLHAETIQKENASGNKYSVAIYENAPLWCGTEMPMRALKPELIEATHKALSAKIFDSLGVAPEYRSSDPLIVGRINHWKAGSLRSAGIRR